MSAIREFLRLESAGGIILMAAALLALILSNSPAAGLYGALLDVHVTVLIGEFGIDKPLLLWINDGLMAVFFLLIGLEIKREVLQGELSRPSQVALPGVAALGGLALPALIFVAFNLGDAYALRGWAIPAATDIAFALGVLYLLGDRVPLGLRTFLLAIAIFDDVAAILIIALLYTAELSAVALGLAAVAVAALAVLNLTGVTRLAPYILVGVALWLCVLKSGVHATIAGVILGLAVPLRATDEHGHSPLRHLEHMLHPWVAFGILPVFAFANAGVSFAGMTLADALDPVTLGIALGLFVGKQIGVFASTALVVRLGLARLPEGAGWPAVYGVALLCGVGFTMSLFIGSLAYEGVDYAARVRLGVLAGSILSAACGYTLLRLTTTAGAATDDGLGAAPAAVPEAPYDPGR